MHRSVSLEAHESGWHGLVTVVEDEVDGQVQFDAEDVAVYGGAEAHNSLKADEPLQKWPARFCGLHAHFVLDQV